MLCHGLTRTRGMSSLPIPLGARVAFAHPTSPGAPQTKVAGACPATVMLRVSGVSACRSRHLHRRAESRLQRTSWKIVGVYGVVQEKRPGHMEDFLHGA